MPTIPISQPLVALHAAFEMHASTRGAFVSRKLILFDGLLAACTEDVFEGSVFYRCTVAHSRHPRALLVDTSRVASVNAHLTSDTDLLSAVLEWARKLTEPDDRVEISDFEFDVIVRASDRSEPISHLDLRGAWCVNHFDARSRWARVHLKHVTLANAEIPRLEFTGWHFEDVDFSGADLSGVTFETCEFHDVKFDGANLSGATFLRCVTRDSTLDLTSADVRGLILVSPVNPRLFDVRMTPSQEQLVFQPRARIVGQDMQPFALRLLRLPPYIVGDLSTVFEGLDLRGARFKDGFADFRSISFKGCDFSGVIADTVSFYRCDLTGANFSGFEAANLSMTQCVMHNTDLSGVVISADLSISTSEVRGARFNNARIRTLSLSGSSLTDVSFRDVAVGTLSFSLAYTRDDAIAAPLQLIARSGVGRAAPLSAVDDPSNARLLCALDNVDFEGASVMSVSAGDVVARDVRGDSPSQALRSSLLNKDFIPYPDF
jgi:uncharacterized protein YjbI with pentapeptide repeats